MTTTAAKLLKLIRRGESETLEFKESFVREAVETVCAFGNTKGGTFLIGVDDHTAPKADRVPIGRHDA